MAEWTILDYAEPGGSNPIASWLQGLPEDAQAAIAVRLLKMENMKTWPEKWVSKLSGFDGLLELRIPWNKVQYRPLAMYLPEMRLVLLSGAIEKGDEIPRRHIDTAVRRRRNLLQKADHVRPHPY